MHGDEPRSYLCSEFFISRRIFIYVLVLCIVNIKTIDYFGWG